MGLLHLDRDIEEVEQKTDVVEENKNQSNQEENRQDKEKMIVMDGPLSAIYTKALAIVYAQRTKENVSQETQQMEMVAVADAHKLMEDVNDDHQEKIEGAYVYVSDGETITTDSGRDAFNSLRLALDMRIAKKHYLCIEGMNQSRACQIVMDYAKKNGYHCYTNRQEMISHLRSEV